MAAGSGGGALPAGGGGVPLEIRPSILSPNLPPGSRTEPKARWNECGYNPSTTRPGCPQGAVQLVLNINFTAAQGRRQLDRHHRRRRCCFSPVSTLYKKAEASQAGIRQLASFTVFQVRAPISRTPHLPSFLFLIPVLVNPSHAFAHPPCLADPRLIAFGGLRVERAPKTGQGCEGQWGRGCTEVKGRQEGIVCHHREGPLTPALK